VCRGDDLRAGHCICAAGSPATIASCQTCSTSIFRPGWLANHEARRLIPIGSLAAIAALGCYPAITRRLRHHRRMPKYAVNDDAVRYVRELIDARRYVLRSRWGDVQSSAADSTKYSCYSRGSDRATSSVK